MVTARTRHSSKGNMMHAIFISYRREDAEGQAGRLFGDLRAEFGEDSVFMDVVGIDAGTDFRRVIDANVASCGVLLAMIGKSWIDARDESGRRRLDDLLDFVRLETVAALKRDIPVIPVLVQGARMPRAEQLPSDLTDLAYRNAVELTHARWDSDVQVLIKALRPHVESKETTKAPRESVVDQSDTAATVGTPGIGGTSGTTDGRGPTLSATERFAKRSRAVMAAGLVATVAAIGGGYAWYQAQQRAAVVALAQLQARERAAAEEAARRQAQERAAAETLARQQAREWAAAEEVARRQAQERAAADAQRQARERALAEEAARRQAQERAAAETLARQQARERAAAEEVARRQAQERAAADAQRQARERALAEEAARHRWQSYNFPPPNRGLLVFSIMPDGNPACASYNGATCLWGQTYDQIDFRRLRPLVCGEAYRAQWRNTGYEDPRHWCNLAKRVARVRS